MKTGIKSKVQKIIEAYRSVNTKHLAEVENWQKATMYSDSYRAEQIQGVKVKMSQNDAEFSQQLQNLICEEKHTLIGTPQTKPADYQMQIANALEFIKLAGNSLTDDRAATILKPFRGDMETMNLFHSVVENQVHCGLTNRFEKTFSETDKMTALVNAFSAVEELAGSALNSNSSGLEQAVRFATFVGNVDAIQSLAESIEGVNE